MDDKKEYHLRNITSLVTYCPLKQQSIRLNNCLECEKNLGISEKGFVKCLIFPSPKRNPAATRYCMDCKKKTKNLRKCIKSKHRILW